MTQANLKRFCENFRFKEEFIGYIGTERERFLRDKKSGLLLPRSALFLQSINNPLWTYELSACQVEDRTNPRKNKKSIVDALRANDVAGHTVAEQLGLRLCTDEVAEKNMPLDIYPEKRYLEISKTIQKAVLMAACRVAGTHIHIGVKNLGHAIRVHNNLRRHLDELCAIGDHSGGERLKLYKLMAPNWNPPHYHGVKHLFRVAQAEKFVDNPRNCWHLIRISIHGTVELRMFGVTENLEEILEWITLIRKRVK